MPRAGVLSPCFSREERNVAAELHRKLRTTEPREGELRSVRDLLEVTTADHTISFPSAVAWLAILPCEISQQVHLSMQAKRNPAFRSLGSRDPQLRTQSTPLMSTESTGCSSSLPNRSETRSGEHWASHAPSSEVRDIHPANAPRHPLDFSRPA